MKAFLHIQTFRNESRFSTWLMRIAINEALMRMRQRKAELRHVSGEKDLSENSSAIQIRDRKISSDPEAIWIQKERNELLKDAVGQLSRDLRLAVHLFGAEEMQRNELSCALQLSKSAVNTRLRRGLRRLRKILTEKLRGREELLRGWI